MENVVSLRRLTTLDVHKLVDRFNDEHAKDHRSQAPPIFAMAAKSSSPYNNNEEWSDVLEVVVAAV
jgi:hypothetical protein